MKTIKYIICLLLITLSVSKSVAQDPNILYNSALENYKAEKFGDAKLQLQQLYDEGYINFELCYNLANCYFREKDIASAILYYERALKFDPYNENVLYNIDVADDYIVDKIEVIPEMFITKFWNKLISLLKPYVWSVILLISLALFLVFILIIFFSYKHKLRKVAFISSIVTLSIVIFTLFINISIKRHFENESAAIVFKHSVSVKGSPSTQGVDLFVIHKGTKVKVTDHIGEWVEVELTNGKIGWMLDEYLERI